MVLKYTPEQLEEKYQKLPEDLKNALFSVETAKVIDKISKENRFSEKKAENLAVLIGQVLLGVLPPENFEKEIKKKLRLKPETASKISTQINLYLFNLVKESLNKLYK